MNSKAEAEELDSWMRRSNAGVVRTMQYAGLWVILQTFNKAAGPRDSGSVLMKDILCECLCRVLGCFLTGLKPKQRGRIQTSDQSKGWTMSPIHACTPMLSV